MNVYTIQGFTGHNPVGTAAMVVARDKGQARRLLDKDLESRGLPKLQPEVSFTKVDTNVAQSVVLHDGEY